MHGVNGDEVEIMVPIGTLVRDLGPAPTSEEVEAAILEAEREEDDGVWEVWEDEDEVAVEVEVDDEIEDQNVVKDVDEDQDEDEVVEEEEIKNTVEVEVEAPILVDIKTIGHQPLYPITSYSNTTPCTGQRFVVAKGGRGGRGNLSFVSGKNRSPQQKEKGRPGTTTRLRPQP